MHRHATHLGPIDDAFDRLSEHALAALRKKQTAFGEEVAEYPVWNIDTDQCTLAFSRSSGDSLQFRITPIATYLATSENWAWAWANDAFPDEPRSRSARLRMLSAKTGYGVFESPSFRVAANEIDELCALALYQLEGVAVFKIKDREPWFLCVVERVTTD